MTVTVRGSDEQLAKQVDTVETVDLILSVGDSFISASGKKFVSGEIYTVTKEEANKLLSVKADYEIRFFKKAEGVGKKAVAKDVDTLDMHPTPQAIAESMNKENEAALVAAKALNKADAISSATRGQGDEAIEEQLATKARISTVGPTANGVDGEVDTAEAKPRGRGRPAGGGIPV